MTQHTPIKIVDWVIVANDVLAFYTSGNANGQINVQLSSPISDNLSLGVTNNVGDSYQSIFKDVVDRIKTLISDMRRIRGKYKGKYIQEFCYDDTIEFNKKVISAKIFKKFCIDRRINGQIKVV